MKKIDLHLHTIKTKWDSSFTFEKEFLKEYIEQNQLDCIAISNHNTFDLNQFNIILDELNVLVLPAVEVSLNTGHILVVSEPDKKDDFAKIVAQVEKIFSDDCSKKYLEVSEFKNIFTDNNYLLIPHYDKDPMVSPEIIKELGISNIIGEVSSYKKWKRYKKKGEITPVIFTDNRINGEPATYKNSYTFLDIETLDFSTMKIALSNPAKVFLSNKGDDEYFTSLGGVNISSKLNLVIGGRSSGKSYLLDNIYKSFDKSKIKYIEQFSIVEKSGEDIFKNLIDDENSNERKKYFKTFGEIIDYVRAISINKDNNELDAYLESLKTNAEETQDDDEYSTCKLFNAELLDEEAVDNIDNLIDAMILLANNEKYSKKIFSGIDIEKFKENIIEMIGIRNSNKVEKQCLIETNKVITTIKNKLDLNSSKTQIKDIHFSSFKKNEIVVDMFNKFIKNIGIEKEISNIPISTFVRKAVRRGFKNSSDLKKFVSNLSDVKVQPIFDNYYAKGDYYSFLKTLEELNVSKDLIEEMFFTVEYSILNKDGFEISGGERAEYHLLNQINDAMEYDMLLIDEPESSFDNIYLNDSVSSLLKKISNKTTVVLTTHNSSLGVLMKPDNIILTEKLDGEFNLYSGPLEEKELKSSNGKTASMYESLMNMLEAGKESYERKCGEYGIVENR